MRVTKLLALAAVVVVAACSKQAPEQPAPEPERPAPAPAPAPPPPTDDSEARRRAEMERMAMETSRRMAAEIATMINFDFDKSDIRSGDASILDRKAAILLANPGVTIRIAGHCDERGSDEYNLALGNRRAASAKQYLVNKGVAATRIEIVSFGEERPLDPASTESAWAKNRRDEFGITGGGDRLVEPR